MKKFKQTKKKTTTKSKPMPASRSKVGRMYLTKLGVPVKVKKITSRGVEVILTLVNKPLTLKTNTLLNPYEKSKVKKTSVMKRVSKKKSHHNLKTLLSTPSVVEETPSPKQVRRGPKGPRSGSVSSVVDPLLLAGTHTRQQICIVLGESEIGKTLTNRDMSWYAGYRIAVLKEKGYSFEQSETGNIRLFKTNLTKISDKIESFTGTLFSRDKVTP